MNCSVLRKFLSTTSLVAVSAALVACSGDVERFGSPAFAGFTSNSKEVITNSIVRSPRSNNVVLNQPMPAAVPTQQVTVSRQPVYTTPAAPLVTNSIKPMRVAQATVPQPYGAHQPVYTAPQVPVYRAAPAPVYQQVQVPVVVQSASPAYVYQQPTVQPDYAPTGAIRKEILARPVKKITTFYSLPRPGPRPKTGYDQLATASVKPSFTPLPSGQVAIAPQAMPPMPQQPEKKGFSITKFFSLPKPGPRGKAVDYTSTSSIRPPAAIPNQQRRTPPTTTGRYQNKVASVAPVSLNRNQVARTSGQWTSVGGSMITVRPGDDISALSRRYGVPAKAIADVNGLVDQSFITPGQRVLIPVYQQAGVSNNPALGQAAARSGFVPPSVMRTPKPNPLRLQSRTPYGQQIIKMQQSANADQRHMVMPGETLSGIARRYNVSLASLAGANRMDVNSPIRMGQRLRVPSPARSGNIDYTSTASINRQPFGGVSAQPSTSMTRAARITRLPMAKPRNLVSKSMPVVRVPNAGAITALPKPKARRKVASLQLRDPASTAIATDATVLAPQTAPKPVVRPAEASDQPKFRWPVRGRIISAYGRKRDGGRNDGINLAVPAGTSVRVAESGTVIYSGSKLKGYGNLVLVQHANGWVTAYAHNNKLLVGKGQQVRRGQIIAEAGKTGEVDSPQLHFELRVKGDPVDPVPYLVSS